MSRTVFEVNQVDNLGHSKLPYKLLHESEKTVEKFTLGLGFHAHSYFCTGETRTLLRRRDIFPKKKDRHTFLDLGCALGHAVILAAYEGWQAYGIDISSDAICFARMNIEDLVIKKYIQSGRAHVAVGNFFPAKFSVERGEFPFQDWFREEIESYATTPISEDAYETLGLDVRNIDLFYHYQVERASNLLSFFADYAAKGALFLLIRTYEDDVSLDSKVKLVERTPEGVELYQKVTE